jgi:uncharacterized protein YegP (UPF0339 family)
VKKSTVPWTWFEIYESKNGWRWRMKSLNGRTIADSSEAYSEKSGAKRAIKSVKRTAHMAGIVEVQP